LPSVLGFLLLFVEIIDFSANFFVDEESLDDESSNERFLFFVSSFAALFARSKSVNCFEISCA